MGTPLYTRNGTAFQAEPEAALVRPALASIVRSLAQPDPIPPISATWLLEQYDVLLLDAYGVLVTHDEVLPHAREFVAELRRRAKPFYILTNDASRTPEHSALRYQGRGLEITADQVITSGSLLQAYFETEQLQGERCIVLGTADSILHVEQAGGEVVAATEDAAVIVLCDERGFEAIPMLDAVLSLLFRRVDHGEPLHLILPNPDLIYPASDGRFGFTAGALALLFEQALRQRYPERTDLSFVRLGKPFAPIFEEALRRLCGERAVMVGDQLGTDIRGANAMGIESVLVTTGLTRLDRLQTAAPEERPTYLLDSLALRPRAT